VATQYTFQWDTTEVADGAVTVTAEALDANNNIIGDASRSFTVSNAPEIVVDIDHDLAFTFTHGAQVDIGDLPLDPVDVTVTHDLTFDFAHSGQVSIGDTPLEPVSVSIDHGAVWSFEHSAQVDVPVIPVDVEINHAVTFTFDHSMQITAAVPEGMQCRLNRVTSRPT
jgi:hypothetical protein